jgi:hypothetical protein
MADEDDAVGASDADTAHPREPRRLAKLTEALRSINATLASIAVLIAAVAGLAGYLGWNLLDHNAATSPPTSTRDCQPSLTGFSITEPLTVNLIGGLAVADFGVSNHGACSVTVPQIRATGRVTTSPGACERPDSETSAWAATPTAEFPAEIRVQIDPGETVKYHESIPVASGRFFAEPMYESDDGQWMDIPGANRVCYELGPPALTIDPIPAHLEGNSEVEGEKLFVTVHFRLSHATDGDVVFDVKTIPGTAVEGDDYVGVDPTKGGHNITIASGQTTVDLPVYLVGDTRPELQETFVVEVLNPVGAVAPLDTATVIIIDDDSN